MEPPQLNYVGIVYPSAQDGVGDRGIAHELGQCSLGNRLVAMIECYWARHLRSRRCLPAVFGLKC